MNYEAFATAPGLGTLVLFIVSLALAAVAVILPLVTIIATVVTRRDGAKTFASFLAALDEGDVTIQYSGPLACFGSYLFGDFCLTITERPNGTRDIQFRHTLGGVTRWVNALRVPKDDIGQPLSRAWIKLCRHVKNEEREQASAKA